MKKTVLTLISCIFFISGLYSQNVSDRVWERRRIDAWIATMGGETFEGQILAADENRLAFWRSVDTFNLDRVKENVVIFKPEDILLIRLRRKSQVWRGAGIGAAIGTTSGAISGAASEPGFLGRAFNTVFGGVIVGVPATVIGGFLGASKRINEDINLNGDKDLYLEILPVLQKRFSLEEAEIISHLADSTFEDTGNEPIKGTPPGNSFDSFRLHIGGGIGVNFTGLGNSSIAIFEQAGMNVPIDDRNRLGLGLEVAGNITPKLRLGLSWQPGQDQYIGGSWSRMLGDTLILLGGEEVSSHSTLAFTFDFVPRPTRRLLLSRWEYFIGGGIVLNQVRVTNTLRGSAFTSPLRSSPDVFFGENERETKYTGVGLQLRAGLDYYVLPSVSFYGQINGSFVLDGMVERYKISLLPTSLPPGGLEEHKINGSNLGILVGMRVHFLQNRN